MEPDDDPRVRALTAELEELRQQIRSLEEAYSAPSERTEAGGRGTHALATLELTLDRLARAAKLRLYHRPLRTSRPPPEGEP